MPIEAPLPQRVLLRPDTRPKWAAITRNRRWTLTEAADALADEFIERHGITVSQPPAAPAAGNGSVGTPAVHGAPTDHPATEPVTDSPEQVRSASQPSDLAAHGGESRREAIPTESVETSPPD